jgi:hypothetical protein
VQRGKRGSDVPIDIGFERKVRREEGYEVGCRFRVYAHPLIIAIPVSFSLMRLSYS